MSVVSTTVPLRSARLPDTLPRPYAVWGPDGQRCGLVDDLRILSRLQAADPQGCIRLHPKRGYVVLSNLDAWLTRGRTFRLRDYLPDTYVSVQHGQWSLLPSPRLALRLGLEKKVF